MILSLHYLRAVAAFMVLISHSRTKFHQVYGEEMTYWWPTGGSAGIDIFFLISGFIITHVAWRHHRREGYASLFLRKRLWRVIPIYWFWTTVALLIFLILPNEVNSSGGATSVLHSYLFIPTESKYLIQNGWSLSYELYFYGLFALALCFPRRAAYGALTLTWLSACVLGLIVPFEHAIARFLTNGLLLEFLAGMGIYGLYHRKWILPRHGAVVVVLWGFAEILFLNWIPWSHPQLYHGLPAAGIVYGAISLESWIRQHPVRWLERLGDASYSIYITHPFVLKAAALALMAGGDPPLLPYFTAGLAMVVLSCLFGYLSYAALERPLQSRAHRLRTAGAPEAPTLVDRWIRRRQGTLPKKVG